MVKTFFNHKLQKETLVCKSVGVIQNHTDTCQASPRMNREAVAFL